MRDTDRIEVWRGTQKPRCSNADFYCELLDRCASHLGIEAFRCDDGNVSESPLRLKIPELVGQLVRAERDGKYTHE